MGRYYEQGRPEPVQRSQLQFESDLSHEARRCNGIADAKAYYGQFLTGFSNIKFEIRDIFGQGNKLTKHWVFSGVHTGELFGIPATGKSVVVKGSTIVKMEKDIILEEQDFFDNLDLLTQLGQIS